MLALYIVVMGGLPLPITSGCPLGRDAAPVIHHWRLAEMGGNVHVLTSANQKGCNEEEIIYL